MQLLDRYLLREWSKAFALALLAMFGILLLEDMYKKLQIMLQCGVSTLTLCRYYLTAAPSFLPAILPLSLLVSILFTLGNFHRNNEITAMRAAGLSLLRISRIFWLAGGFLCFFLFYLNGQLVPWSIEQARSLYENLRFKKYANKATPETTGLISPLVFENQNEGRLWLMESFSQYTHQGFGINVYQRSPDGKETERLLAEEGYYDKTKQYWIFQKVRQTLFDATSEKPIKSVFFTEKAAPSFTENPLLMKTLHKRPKDLSLFELKIVLANTTESPRRNAYAIRYHNTLVSPFICLIVVGIGIVFSCTGVRTNPMVGVAKSIGLFFVYYLMSNTCTLLGTQSIVSPHTAAWAPNIVMTFLTLFLLWRLNRQ